MMLSDAQLHDLGTFWVGSKISPIEELCFASMKAMGHKLTMYCYERPDNLPNWIETRSASEIYDPDFLIMQSRKMSPAAHADMFRLKMIQKTDKVWVDGDMLLLQPIVKTDDYIIAAENDNSIGNSIMRCPSDSAYIEAAVRKIEQRMSTYAYEVNETVAQERFGVDKPARLYDMVISAFGPQILNSLGRHPEIKNKILPKQFYFPIFISNVRAFVQRPMIVKKSVSAETIGIHLWSSRLKRAVSKRSHSQVENSFFGAMCKKYHVSFDSIFTPVDGEPQIIATPA